MVPTFTVLPQFLGEGKNESRLNPLLACLEVPWQEATTTLSARTEESRLLFRVEVLRIPRPPWEVLR